MLHRIRLVALACVLLAGAAHAASPFHVERLDEGVLLFRPEAGDKFRTNSLVVVRSDGLLVVDAQPSPGAAKELLAAIAATTNKPVRYLVLTHPHAECAGGASAFPDSTLVAASEGYVESLKDASFDFAAEMGPLSSEGWTEPARRFPTVVVIGSTRLDDPRHPVDLHSLGQRHSTDDLMIELPNSKLVHLGGLLFHADRNPYGRDAKVTHWLAALNQTLKRSPDKIVGLRGEVVSTESLKEQRDALAWLRAQVDEAFINQIPMDKMREYIESVPGFGNRFTRSARPYLVSTLIDQMIEETVAARRMRGLH